MKTPEQRAYEVMGNLLSLGRPIICDETVVEESWLLNILVIAFQEHERDLFDVLDVVESLDMVAEIEREGKVISQLANAYSEYKRRRVTVK